MIFLKICILLNFLVRFWTLKDYIHNKMRNKNNSLKNDIQDENNITYNIINSFFFSLFSGLQHALSLQPDTVNYHAQLINSMKEAGNNHSGEASNQNPPISLNAFNNINYLSEDNLTSSSDAYENSNGTNFICHNLWI